MCHLLLNVWDLGGKCVFVTKMTANKLWFDKKDYFSPETSGGTPSAVCHDCRPTQGSHVAFLPCQIKFKDVRAHCYCASQARTLYLTWRVPRHVFQARAPSRNSTKYRAGDLCGNLICECFCWMLGDPHFFFGRSLHFLILSIMLKNKTICPWEVLIISHILFK